MPSYSMQSLDLVWIESFIVPVQIFYFSLQNALPLPLQEGCMDLLPLQTKVSGYEQLQKASFLKDVVKGKEMDSFKEGLLSTVYQVSVKCYLNLTITCLVEVPFSYSFHSPIYFIFTIAFMVAHICNLEPFLSILYIKKYTAKNTKKWFVMEHLFILLLWI